ncbi:MAG: type II secretion system protein GspE, partial [Oscillospiraceae bacterium]
EPARIKTGKGCERCNNTGYKGRTAIYEMVSISRAVSKLISQGATEAEIKVVAQQEGATFLRESAAQLVLDGIIDMRQLIKTTYGMDD